jgi:hypothetical protein
MPITISTKNVVIRIIRIIPTNTRPEMSINFYNQYQAPHVRETPHTHTRIHTKRECVFVCMCRYCMLQHTQMSGKLLINCNMRSCAATELVPNKYVPTKALQSSNPINTCQLELQQPCCNCVHTQHVAYRPSRSRSECRWYRDDAEWPRLTVDIQLEP